MIFKLLGRFAFILFCLFAVYHFLMIPYFEKLIPSTQKVLYVYAWADRFDESTLQKFEEETGIKVFVNNYESNEELLTKLEKMSYVDCDLIFPGGYIIEDMVKSNLIKKIDKSKCNFIHRIYPEFLTQHDDCRDEYSVPIYWDMLGIGYNNQKIKPDDLSLKYVLDRDISIKGTVGMIDDARQSISLAAIYLGFSLESLNKDQLKQMRMLLNRQKKWVGSYSDSLLGYFLASGSFDIVVSEREYICQQMLKYDHISFAVPKEGSSIRVDRVVLSRTTEKDELIYKLINFLYSPEILKVNCEKYCLLPTCKDIFEKLDQKYKGVKGFNPDGKSFKRLKTLKNVLTHKQINDFWIKLKAS